MNLELYSLFLTLACIALILVTAVSLVGYFSLSTWKSKMLLVDYFDYIKAIGALSLIATIGTLIYQFYYLTPVCEYCWWQRIFMYPIDFVALGSIMLKNKKNELIIVGLALVGAVFAGLHYYFHYKAIILSQDVALPCSSVGIIPSCTESPVLIFGFVTIPLMALVVFLSILWLCFLAFKSRTVQN